MKSALFLLLAACGTVKENPDAAVNGDGVVIDGPPSACANGGKSFTGEHLDWDSSGEDASFCGVFQAKWTVHGSTDAKETATTAPNGRAVIACLPTDALVRVDVTVPTAASQCATRVMGQAYGIDGIAMVSNAVLAALPSTANFRARSISSTRVPQFYMQIGPTYDPTKGGLLVHVVGPAQLVTISASHDTAEFYDGSLWQAQGTTAGAVVQEVYFPNVPVGTATISSSLSGTVGVDSVPIEANKITYATIVHP